MSELSDLRQIVYISRAAPTCHDDEVLNIGRVAKELNSKFDITGLLLFDGTRFIQAIEGPADAVQATIDRICADERHVHISIASDRIVARRQFGDWSMQARRTPTGVCSPSFLRKIKELMQEVDDVALQALFIGFTVLAKPSRS